jgi:hypothetical protein
MERQQQRRHGGPLSRFFLPLDRLSIRTWFWWASAITVALFLLKFSVTGFGVYGDGLGYYTPLRSLLFDGDLRVDDEYRYYAESAEAFGAGARVFGEVPPFSKYTLGLGVVLLPFFAWGHLLALGLRGLGLPVALNGLTWPYELGYCLGSVLLGVASLVLSYRIARLFCSPPAAALATGGLWFASPLSFYLTVEVSMSHAVSAFLVTAFLWGVLTWPWLTHWRLQIALGGLIGLAAWVRPQDGLFIVVPILWQGIEGYRARNLAPYFWAVARLSGAALLLQAPQLLIYLWQYGGLDRIPYLEEGQARGYGGSFHWFQPALWQVLFSGHRGLFIWHPLTFASAIGLILFARRRPALGFALLAAFALQVYFIGAWWCWWQGASVGGRMFSNSTALFVLGLATLWDGWSQGRRRVWSAVAGLTLLAILWNALIILQYQSALIPPEAPVTLGELYGNQARVIPHFLSHLQRRLGGG